jgi:predicted ATP-grasp superfamily ATP-dependent carboligase
MAKSKVLVVGTTADYIDELDHRFPDRVVFLTDARERRSATAWAKPRSLEILLDLADEKGAVQAARRHLDGNNVTLSGVACFDCESLVLAADIARVFALPYPSREAVLVCRDKHRSKQLWKAAGIACPDGVVIEDVGESSAAFARLGHKCVVKPRTGSGSEFVQVAETEIALCDAFRAVHAGLVAERTNRMYAPYDWKGERVEPRRSVLIEAFVEGPEYSADIWIDGPRIAILRIARKLWVPHGRLMQTLAYIVPGRLPANLDEDRLAKYLMAAVRAVGIERAVCMVDFIIADGQAVLLELAPRPGGDCLPQLIRHATGRDMLGYVLDVAERRESEWLGAEPVTLRVGLVLRTDATGQILKMDAAALTDDARTVQYCPVRRPGDRLEGGRYKPAESLLGFVIFKPYDGENIERECRELREKLVVVTDDC